MNTRSILSVGLALLIVGSIGGVGIAAATGASTAGTQVHRASASANVAGSNWAQTGTATGANGTRGPFQVTVRNITSCGPTCREVTATLTNEGNRTARNVTAVTTILAGDTVLDQRRAQVGRLAPNETVTRTVRIDVTPEDIRAIQANQGQITIRTVVTSEQYNETFVSQRQVL